MTDQPDIKGAAVNGRRAMVSFGPYTGVAGIRERVTHWEVAYHGQPPSRFPAVGKIGDKPATATGVSPGRAAKGFTVLIVEIVPLGD